MRWGPGPDPGPRFFWCGSVYRTFITAAPHAPPDEPAAWSRIRCRGSDKVSSLQCPKNLYSWSDAAEPFYAVSKKNHFPGLTPGSRLFLV